MNFGDGAAHRRHSGDESRIPVPSSPILRRSGSQRLSNCFTIAEHSRKGSTTTYAPSPILNRHRSLQSLNGPLSSCLSPDRDDDLDSLQSFGSNASVASTMSQCDHASFARNGTTFSSRQKRYVVHCSPQTASGEEYLTPTQRANRTIRKLKNLLATAQAEVTEKDKEILKLTKEVVELRLVKAGSTVIERDERESELLDCLLQSPSERTSCVSPQDITSTSEQTSSSNSTLMSGAKDVLDHSHMPYNGGGIFPLPTPLGDVPPSLVDSGHFEDLNNTKDWATSSPQSSPRVPQPQPTSNLPQMQPPPSPQFHPAIENLRKQHEEEIRELREKSNDKIDSLLQRITEANDRYCELRPKFEAAESRISELEKENELLKKTHEESEEHHKNVYLQMYKKGQEAALFDTEVVQANKESEQNSQPVDKDLLNQLDVTRKELEDVKGMYRRLVEQRKSTQNDPEMTLQFLKSAFYYFLTDRNTHDHLQAIESILGFSESEKLNIEKASYYWK